MNILVITGSPHRDGTSAAMAEAFIRGAEEAGHQVRRFDAAFRQVAPCIGCDYCRSHDHQCFRQDDMTPLIGQIMEAQEIVYVTPLYYHGVTAQLKAVMDRYHAVDDLIRGGGRRARIIVTAGYPRDWVFDGLKATMRTTLRHLRWEDQGGIYAYGIYSRDDMEGTDYLRQAYELGRSMDLAGLLSLGSSLTGQVLAGERPVSDYAACLVRLIPAVLGADDAQIDSLDIPDEARMSLFSDRAVMQTVITEEQDRASLLSTLLTYIASRQAGHANHSRIYMDQVTALRKALEGYYQTDVQKFCGS